MKGGLRESREDAPPVARSAVLSPLSRPGRSTHRAEERAAGSGSGAERVPQPVPARIGRSPAAPTTSPCPPPSRARHVPPPGPWFSKPCTASRRTGASDPRRPGVRLPRVAAAAGATGPVLYQEAADPAGGAHRAYGHPGRPQEGRAGVRRGAADRAPARAAVRGRARPGGPRTVTAPARLREGSGHRSTSCTCGRSRTSRVRCGRAARATGAGSPRGPPPRPRPPGGRRR